MKFGNNQEEWDFRSTLKMKNKTEWIGMEAIWDPTLKTQQPKGSSPKNDYAERDLSAYTKEVALLPKELRML